MQTINFELLKPFLTKENITLFLSILGVLGSFSSWVYIFIKNRKNINFQIVGQRYCDDSSLLIYMMFTNKSRLPIAITNIGVYINSTFYSCIEIPIVALEETTRCKNEIISHHEYKSLPMPIVISGLGGTSGYVYFEFPISFPRFRVPYIDIIVTYIYFVNTFLSLYGTFFLTFTFYPYIM